MKLNNLDQLIKKQDLKVAMFGGMIARVNSLVPINFKDWRLVPKVTKEETCDLIIV